MPIPLDRIDTMLRSLSLKFRVDVESRPASAEAGLRISPRIIERAAAVKTRAGRSRRPATATVLEINAPIPVRR
jgi:hypothetical protein